MWKIKTTLDNESVVLQLIGRIEGNDLTELRKALAAEAGDRDLVLDVKNVKLVDRDAVAFLACCEASGAELRNCPGYIREWVARERKEETKVTRKIR